MEVTNSNFKTLLPKVKEAIANAHFIAIDCELTGLNSGLDINAYDTQRQYYEKIRKAAKDFLIIQYGLCTFQYDDIENKFTHESYNFYVFPRSSNRYVPDRRFLCQASSIDFLIKNGFDFNKLFREGISYLNNEEESKYNMLLERQKQKPMQAQNSSSPQNDKTKITMTDKDKLIVENILKQIKSFLSSNQTEMNLPRCNAFIRRLVYQEAGAIIANNASLETRNVEKERILVITRLESEKDREERELKNAEREAIEFQDSVGFSEIVKCLVGCGKLIIGHNMCLDMLHTIDKFLTQLPEDYDEFKELVNYSFPNVLDTKYMSSSEPFKELIDSTVLSHLYHAIRENPFNIPTIEAADNCNGYNLDSNKQHEAGFDAFITGVSFLTMWGYLGEKSDISKPFSNFSLLDKYKNRLFLMRLYDANFIKLDGKDPVPSRDHVLYIEFPNELKLNDILQLFSPFGSIYVAWIDDRSAYVGLGRKEQVTIALKTLSQSTTCFVTTYARRQAHLSGLSITSAPTLTISKRKRSTSSSLCIKSKNAGFGESVGSKKIKVAEDAIESSREMVPISTNSDLGIPIQRLETTETVNIKRVNSKIFQESGDWE